MKHARLILAVALVAACQKEPAAPGPAPEQPQPRQEQASTDATEPERTAHVEAQDGPALPALDPSRIDAQALAALLEGATPPTVIDVRSEDAWQASRIPGSINLPVHRLGRSAAPRAGAAVVVGDGWGSARLDEEVAALRDAGLDVRALDGGMQAWCRTGGPVTSPCTGTDRIPPAAALSRFNCADRKVILALSADAAERGRAQSVVPDAVVVTPEEVAATAQRLTRGGLQLVVLADADGTGCDALLTAARSESGAHAFCVEGGLAALEVVAQSQLALATKRPLVSSGRAGTTHADGVRAPKGCGCR